MAKIYRISGRVLGAVVSGFHLAYLASYEVIFQGVSLSTIAYFDLINPFSGLTSAIGMKLAISPTLRALHL